MNALMMAFALWAFDGAAGEAAAPTAAACPFDATAIFCGKDGDQNVCCPGETPLCCGGGKLGCCPSDTPWLCTSSGRCFEKEEDTKSCEGLVSHCL